MRVLYTATVVSHICQFHLPYLKWFQDNGWEVHVAARNNLAEKNGLKLEYVDQFIEVPFRRSPFSLKNLKAKKQLKKLLGENFYDLIICNTPVGGIVTRLAAKKTRKKGTKLMYIAHGFHFYQGGPKKNWLIWYPIEKFFARYADVLLTINQMDYALAQKNFRAKNVKYIPGLGVNLQQFQMRESNADLRSELNLPTESKLILSVGELNDNKNHSIIIKALAELKDSNIYYLIAGNGPKKEDLKFLAKEYGVENNFYLLGYRRDLAYIYSNVDVFVLPSRREGLGLAAIEAMSFGLPIVTSNRHGINDYSIEGKTGYKYDPNDYKGFASGIKKILEDPEMRQSMSDHNRQFAKTFSIESSLQAFEQIIVDIQGASR